MLWGAARFFCVGSGAATMEKLRRANAQQQQWAFGLMDLAADPLPRADMLLSRRISEVAEPQAALSCWHCLPCRPAYGCRVDLQDARLLPPRRRFVFQAD